MANIRLNARGYLCALIGLSFIYWLFILFVTYDGDCCEFIDAS